MLLMFLMNPLAIYFFSDIGGYQNRYDVPYFFLSLFMIQNWGLTDTIRWNIPAWSISTEFAAYLAFPFLTLALKRIMPSTKFYSFVILIVLGVLISLLYRIFDCHSLGDKVPSMGLYRCLVEFSMGMIVGFIWLYFSDDPFETWHLGLWVALLISTSLFFRLPDFYWVPVTCSLLILACSRQDGHHVHLLGCQPLYFLGEISYSTYLVHYFVKDWVKFLSGNINLYVFFVYLFVVFIISVVLYRYIELPGRQSMQTGMNKLYSKVSAC
jgi:peptidoglycan/LPS O-acetylase OafA/YrhL